MLTKGGDELIMKPANEVCADALETFPAVFLCHLGCLTLLCHSGSRCDGLCRFTWRSGLGNDGLDWFGGWFGWLLGFRLLLVAGRFGWGDAGLDLLLLLLLVLRSLGWFWKGDFGPRGVECHLDLIRSRAAHLWLVHSWSLAGVVELPHIPHDLSEEVPRVAVVWSAEVRFALEVAPV